MTSTVTTATVATLAASATSYEMAQLLALLVAVLLAFGLLARQLVGTSLVPRTHALAHGIDIGLAPLLVVFLVGIVVSSWTFFAT
jgi:hypothetical protein